MANTLIAQRYQFDPENPFGQGGMGTVYLGRDIQTGEKVAVKALKKEIILKSPGIVERFRLEGEALRQLNHPNIVKMLDATEANGGHYLVMEYVSGGSLRDLLNREPNLPIQRVLYIALDLADALTRAHRLNILHRDIKPGNVLIAEDGTPRLTDFGMARVGDVHVTEPGAIVGTLAYISPEALQSDEPDERADIWAFGVMLYEMLVGERPFNQDQMGPLVHAILTQRVPDLEKLRPDLPAALIDLVYRMLKKDRNHRIPSIRLVGAELEALIRGAPAGLQHVVSPDSDRRFAVATPTPILTDPEQVLPPHHLPAQTTPFVGREADLDALGTRLDDPATRLITVLGPGGIGKTRIAVALAESRLREFTDGVYFVPLAGLESPDLIPLTIADQINFTFSGSGDPLDELVSYLSEKEMLLILDNFEHLIDGAKVVARLLKDAPRLQIIVTSRERLRLRGEHIHEVTGMKLPSSTKPNVLETTPAAQLFTQSARLMLPDFELDNDNSPHIARIIELVNGLPLGIELAAGWLESLDIDEISQEIERSLDFLETDLRDVPERHRSLRAVFDYSWNLMTPDEREVFMKLSIFRGGFEREAAQQVTGASLRNLTALVNKSLVQRSPDGRYHMPKTLRQYGQERFEADCTNQDDAYECHAMYYATMLENLQDAFDSKNEPVAVETVEKELENLRVAWHWAVKKEYWEALDKVIHTLMLFFQARSMLREGIKQFGSLADLLEAKGIPNEHLYWRARSREATLKGRIGNYTESYAISQQVYEYFHARDEAIECVHALSNLSYAAMMLGQYDESIAHAKNGIEHNKERGVKDSAWFSGMGNLGYAYYLAGRLQEARDVYEELNVQAEQADLSPVGLAFGYNNLGEILRDMGQFEPAHELIEKSHAIFKSYKQRRGMAFTINNLGGLAFMLGQYDRAREMYQQSYELSREIGDKNGIGHALSALGNTASYSEDYDDARSYYQQSLEVRREIGDQRGIADSLSDLARLALTQKQPDDACRFLDESLAIRREIQDRQGIASALANMGYAHWMQNDLSVSRRYLLDALEIAQDIGYSMVIGQVKASLGYLDLLEKKYDDAMANLREALAIGTDSSLSGIQLYALAAIARVQSEQGNDEQALELVSQVLQHPRTFIPMTEQIAMDLFEKLTATLPESTITTIMEQSRAISLNQTVQNILKK